MPWYVVVIEGEGYPEAVGPYRSEARADAVAEEWNSTHSSEDGLAHVRPCKQSLSEVDQ